MGRADEVMLDATAEGKGKTVGIDAPHRGADPKGRALPRDDFEPHRRAHLEPLVGPDFGTEGTDVERSRQEAARSDVDAMGQETRVRGYCRLSCCRESP